MIPAHPLALDPDRKFDKQSQRALSRYYVDAGSGGLAVGVHSTQFAIREVGLYRPVLELAIETARDWTDRPLVMIAGAVGKTAQAVEEARTARVAGLPRGAAVARRAEGRQRGRADRALRGGREGDAADRLLPADGGGRHPAVARLLGALRRDRQCRGDQGGAVQPLPHARCRLRHRQRPRRGAHHALHRQRRSHRGRSRDAAGRAHRQPRGDPALPGRPARALERVDARRGEAAGAAEALGLGRRRSRPRCWRSIRS